MNSSVFCFRNDFPDYVPPMLHWFAHKQVGSNSAESAPWPTCTIQLQLRRFVQSTRGARLHPWSFGTRAREKWHLGFPGCHVYHVSCWLCSVTWKKHLETLWSFQSICKHGTVCHMVQNVHTSKPFSRSVSPSLSSLSLYQYATILVWVYLSTVMVLRLLSHIDVFWNAQFMSR